MALTAIVGPYIAAYMLNFKGRRFVFMVLQFLTSIFYLLMLTSSKNKFWIIIVMRALIGLSVGGISAISPTMLVEIAPPGLSGFFGNLTQTGICTGMMIIYLQGNWTVNLTKNKTDWKSLEITAATVNIISCVLIWFCPETGNSNQESEKSNNNSHDSILERKYFTKLLVGITLMVIQQFTGINAIAQNLDDNLRDAKVPLDSGIGSALSMIFMIIGVFAGGSVIDKLGRKPLFVASCLGCGVTLLVFSMNYVFKWSGWLALICICLYMFFFGFAVGPVPWYTIPELFPQSLRALGNSIISASNQLLTFIILFVYPVMVGNKNPDTGKYTGGIGFMPTCIFYSCCCFFGALFGFFYITEPVATQSLDSTRLLE